MTIEDRLRGGLADEAHQLTADVPPIGTVVRRARWRTATVAVASALAIAALAGVGTTVIANLAAPPDVVVTGPTTPASPPSEVTVTVGDARLTVPADWRIVELDAGGDEPCEVGLTYFTRPVLYVADVQPTGNPAPCAPDYTKPSTVGVYAFDLDGAIRSELDGADPVEINGLTGSMFVMDSQHHYPLPDGSERVTRADIRHYRFPSVDLGLLVRADPDPDLAEAVITSVEPVSPAAVESPTPSPAPAPPSLPPPSAGPLPDTLVAISDADDYGLVRLDPLTGETIATIADARQLGQGAGSATLAPDGTTVFYGRVDTGCRSEIVRVPIEGGVPEVVALGGRLAIGPDGDQLAYVTDPDICMRNRPALVVLDLATGQERTWTMDPIDGTSISIASLSWSPDGASIALVLGYGERTDTLVGAPERFELRVLDLTADAELTDGRLVGSDDARAVAWRGQLGTLAVATDDAIIEIGPSTGETLDTLVAVDGEVWSLGADPSGRHLLYVLAPPDLDGEAGKTIDLYRWSGGDPVLLAQELTSADW